MRRIVLTLTDDEYANLEARAQADRRTVRDMAARLVTLPDPAQMATITTQPFTLTPWNPIWPPNVWCGGTGDVPLPPNSYTIFNGGKTA